MKVNSSTLLRIDSERSRTVNVLGVKIDDVSTNQIVKIVEEWILASQKETLSVQKHYVLPEAKGKVLAKRGFYIVTPNPEIVLMAQEDKELKQIINNADLSIPDGNGLKIATDIVCNSPGVNVMEELVKISSEKGFTVGFLGGKVGVAEKTAECLQKKYKNLKMSFVSDGGEIDMQGNVVTRSEATRQSISSTSSNQTDRHAPLAMTEKVDILFVAFGPPKQEKWIAKNLENLPVKVMMAVGGSFDYISGNIPRAPKWLRDLRLEWLFRLIVQPWRIKRQLALIKYVWLLTQAKFKA